MDYNIDASAAFDLQLRIIESRNGGNQFKYFVVVIPLSLFYDIGVSKPGDAAGHWRHSSDGRSR